MGRRGPPPKPTALKLVTGNPGHRRLNKKEPKPVVGSPPCPTWLSAGAKAHWEGMVPRLEAMRVLSAVDQDALATYCETFARWQAVQSFINRNGEVYPIKNGRGDVIRLKLFPQARLAQQLLHSVRVYQQEFGLTPSSRSQVHEVVDPAEEELCNKFFGNS